MNQPESVGMESGKAAVAKVPVVPLESSGIQGVLSASRSSDAGVEPGEGREVAASDLPLPPVWSRYIDSRLKQFCTR